MSLISVKINLKLIIPLRKPYFWTQTHHKRTFKERYSRFSCIKINHNRDGSVGKCVSNAAFFYCLCNLVGSQCHPALTERPLHNASAVSGPKRARSRPFMNGAALR